MHYLWRVTDGPTDSMWCGVVGLHHCTSSCYCRHVVGIGLRGSNPHDKKCWMYYPEDDCLFYRCTVFSHYAEKNVPSSAVELPTIQLAGQGDGPVSGEGGGRKGGPYWSLMFEISESQHKPVDLATVVQVLAVSNRSV